MRWRLCALAKQKKPEAMKVEGGRAELRREGGGRQCEGRTPSNEVDSARHEECDRPLIWDASALITASARVSPA